MTYDLPVAASSTLEVPDLKLVLHGIGFSHYVERARWALRLLGVPYEEVTYLPMLHMWPIVRLQRQFKQGPGPPTASSKSPAATPCLAIYTADGQPVCLLQDSALICRYAVLRAAALHLPHAQDLYGLPLGLTANGTSQDAAEHEQQPAGARGEGDLRITGGNAFVQELEQRLSGTMGIEVRRVLYYHLLPSPSTGGALFINNSNNTLAARVGYWISRLLLPRFLVINSSTAARGQDRLLAEFDYLDGLLKQQQQQKVAASSTTNAPKAAQDGVASSPVSNEPPQLPFYLTGSKMTIADVLLACLAGPLLCIPNELKTGWQPPLDTMPLALKGFIQDLQQRPTGKFVLEMWRVHGPVAGNAGTAGDSTAYATS